MNMVPPQKNIPECLSWLVKLGQRVVCLRHDASARSLAVTVCSEHYYIWQNRAPPGDGSGAAAPRSFSLFSSSIRCPLQNARRDGNGAVAICVALRNVLIELSIRRRKAALHERRFSDKTAKKRRKRRTRCPRIVSAFP
jgi:hypothetical protein